MRLRLSVQRNNLPTTNILWTVPDTNSAQAYTITRLLEDVNRVLPLEAEQWGLEDYLVELGGFECLHFSPVFQTLKEDDHVSIRPLLTAEVRSRTLCGRYQISDGGQHLVDGIPFGRPYLRQPNRPSVRIPPRKRRRLEDDAGAGAEGSEVVGLITANGETSPQLSGSILLSGATEHTPKRSYSWSDKSVRFIQPKNDELDGSEEDDEDFAPGVEDEDSNSSNTSSSDSEESSESDEADNDSDSDSDSDSDTSSDSDSESSSGSDSSDHESVRSSSAPEVESSTIPKPIPSKPPVPPGSGLKETKQRNRRRAETLKLKRLKETGKLPSEATLDDYRRYLEGSNEDTVPPTDSSPAKPMATSTGKRKRLDEEVPAEAAVDEATELARRKQELIERLTEETRTPAEAPLTPTAEVVSMSSPRVQVGSPSGGPLLQVEGRATEKPVKRLRPDVSAIGRMLAHQTKNTDKKLAKSKKPAVEDAPPEPEGASDPDFWKTRLTISAFECWDEEHELSAPPFPFKQHWDPASKLMREKTNKNRKKRAKRPSPRPSSASPEENNETTILDYDDSSGTAKQESESTVTAIESQLMQDVQVATRPDLPPLPDDVEAFPVLYAADIKVGAIIAFRLWVINPATVTPEFSEYKTAVVEKEGDSGNGAGTFRLKLAERDIPKKEQRKVDGEGNPVYNANDGFQMDDDGDDDDGSVFEGSFYELVNPKLLSEAAEQ